MTTLVLPLPLVAAGTVVTDSLGRDWDPKQHPRGRDGKFIHTFKRIRAFFSPGDTEPWMTGEVQEINPDGTLLVKVTKTTDPNLVDPLTGQHYVGNYVEVTPDSVESLNEKAILQTPAELSGKGLDKHGLNGLETTTSKAYRSKFFPETNGMPGLVSEDQALFGLMIEIHDGGDADSYEATFKQQKGHASVLDYAKYIIALRMERKTDGKLDVNGDPIQHPIAQEDFRIGLRQLGVPDDVIDDTPDGRSGVAWLADKVNMWRSPQNGHETVPLTPGATRELTFPNGNHLVAYGHENASTPPYFEVHDSNGNKIGTYDNLTDAREKAKLGGASIPSTDVNDTPGPPPEPDEISPLNEPDTDALYEVAQNLSDINEDTHSYELHTATDNYVAGHTTAQEFKAQLDIIADNLYADGVDKHDDDLEGAYWDVKNEADKIVSIDSLNPPPEPDNTPPNGGWDFGPDPFAAQAEADAKADFNPPPEPAPVEPDPNINYKGQSTPDLNWKQVDAIKKYVIDSSDLNGTLRSFEEGDIATGDLKTQMDLLDEVIAKSPELPEGTVLFRGLAPSENQNHEYDNFIHGLYPGAKITDKAYMSTSFNRAIASDFIDSMEVYDNNPSGKPVMIQIDVPKGVRGYDVDANSGSIYEQEIILARNTQIEVTDVQKDAKGVTIVKAKIIGGGDGHDVSKGPNNQEATGGANGLDPGSDNGNTPDIFTPDALPGGFQPWEAELLGWSQDDNGNWIEPDPAHNPAQQTLDLKKQNFDPSQSYQIEIDTHQLGDLGEWHNSWGEVFDEYGLKELDHYSDDEESVYFLEGDGGNLKDMWNTHTTLGEDVFYAHITPSGSSDAIQPTEPNASSPPPEPAAPAVHAEPDPNTEDWKSLVDSTGPYRVDSQGNKLHIGDKVTGADGKEYTVKKFESNNKGVVVTDGKKNYARARNKLTLSKNEPAPAAKDVKAMIGLNDGQNMDSFLNGLKSGNYPPGSKLHFDDGAQITDNKDGTVSYVTPDGEILGDHATNEPGLIQTLKDHRAGKKTDFPKKLDSQDQSVIEDTVSNFIGAGANGALNDGDSIEFHNGTKLTYTPDNVWDFELTGADGKSLNGYSATTNPISVAQLITEQPDAPGDGPDPAKQSGAFTDTGYESILHNVGQFIDDANNGMLNDGSWVEFKPSGYKLRYSPESDYPIELFDNNNDLLDAYPDSSVGTGAASQISKATPHTPPSAPDIPNAPETVLDNPQLEEVHNAVDDFITKLDNGTIEDGELLTLNPSGVRLAYDKDLDSYLLYDSNGEEVASYGSWVNADTVTSKLFSLHNEHKPPTPTPAPETDPKAEVAKELDSLRTTIPFTWPKVQTLFPGMNQYQATQYRNAGFALDDAIKAHKGGGDHNKPLDKAIANAKNSGPLGEPLYHKLIELKAAANGFPQPKTGINALPDGYVQPPDDAIVFAKSHPNEIGTWYLAKHSDGTVWRYGPDNDTYKLGETAKTNEDSDWAQQGWDIVVPGATSPSSNAKALPDGFTQPPADANVYMKFGSNLSNSYIVEHADGTLWRYNKNESPYLLAGDNLLDDSVWLKSGWTKVNDKIGASTPAAPSVPAPLKVGPNKPDKLGNPMYAGDAVKWDKYPGESYKVYKFENNDVGVVIKNTTNNKKHAVNKNKLSVQTGTATSTPTTPGAPTPKVTPVTPATPLAPPPPPKPKKIVPTLEPNPNSPWYGEDKLPNKPVQPAQLTPDAWVPDDWMQKAADNWLAKTTNPTKGFEKTQQYSKWKSVAETGSISSLDSLKQENFITDEMYNEAKSMIDGINAKNQVVLDKYNAEVKQYHMDKKAWNEANGIDTSTFPGAPKLAKEPFLGGETDWSKAPTGTPSGESVLDALKNGDSDIALRGASIATDGDEIEDLDVRAMKVIDKDGFEQLEFKFKVTAWAGDALAAKMQYDPAVMKDNGIHLKTREVDPATGLHKYTDNNAYVGSGQTYRMVDPQTGASIEFYRSQSGTTSVSAPTVHNEVRMFMPTDSTPQDYENALQHFGIKNANPARPEDIELFVKNKLISVFGGNTDPTHNHVGNAVDTKLAEIQLKYGITVNNVRMGADAKGRIKLMLDDEGRDKMIKYGNVEGFTHNVANSGSISTWQSILIGPNSGLNSTHVRWSEGIGGSGMSSGGDMNSGAGGDFLYTRVMHNKPTTGSSYGGAIVMHPKAMMRRLDVYANQSDNGTGKHSNNKLAYDIMKGNPYEVVWKHNIPVEDMWYASLSNETLRQQLIQALKNHGIDEINGVPVEEFILGPNSPIPTMDDAQWSTDTLPPAIETLVAKYT